MALEDLTGTKYIDSLNAANPVASDDVAEGDDHIRGIKNVLKTTFPGLDGAVNATDTELNLIDGGTARGTDALASGDGILINDAGVMKMTDVDTVQTFMQSGITTDLSGDSSPQLGGDLDCNAHQIQWSQGADVASATALAVLTDGNYFDVTGTTAITSINTTGGIGTLIKLHFDGALTLTHDAADLILPGGANITTAAGDEAEFVEYASGDYRCTNYSKADGTSVVAAAGGASVLGDLTDVSMDITNLVDGLIIQTDSDGSAPTTGTLNGATNITGIGKDVFSALTSGVNMVAIGNDAFKSVTTASDNVAIGSEAAPDFATGVRNVFIGNKCAENRTHGDDNILIGYQGDSTQTGNSNICIGRYAGIGTSAAENVAIGYSALGTNSEGSNNVAVGQGAVYSQGWGTTDPHGNTGIGAGAMRGQYPNSSGGYNTAVGNTAMPGVEQGTNNLALGYHSARSNSPSGEIVNSSNTICLGNNNISNLYCNDTSISSSDERDKTDIENFTAGLDFVKQMRPIIYRWDKRSWYADVDNPSEAIEQRFVATEGQTTFVIEGGYTCSNSCIEVEVNREFIASEDFTATDDVNVVLDNAASAGDEVFIRCDSSCTSQNVLDAVPDGSLKNPKLHIGFISQEIQPLEQALGYSEELGDGTIDRDTELVCNTNEDKTAMGLKYERFVPILVNAIKELSTKNEELLARITTLENA